LPDGTECFAGLPPNCTGTCSNATCDNVTCPSPIPVP
jgi:hypothetical protein